MKSRKIQTLIGLAFLAIVLCAIVLCAIVFWKKEPLSETENLLQSKVQETEAGNISDKLLRSEELMKKFSNSKQSEEETISVFNGTLAIQDIEVRELKLKSHLKAEKDLLQSHKKAEITLRERNDEEMLERVLDEKEKSEQRIALLTLYLAQHR